MNTVQRLISAGFATAALAAATVPALAYSVWPDIDLEGHPAASPRATRAARPAADGYVRDVALRADDEGAGSAAALRPVLLRR